MDFHPIASIFPLMDDDELMLLREDIKQHGLIEPLTIFEGKVLDGRNRATACLAEGITPKTREFPGSYLDAVAFAWSENKCRRHLTPSQAAACIIDREDLVAKFNAEAKERQHAAGKRGGEGGRGKKKTLTQKIGEGNDRHAKEADAALASEVGTNRQYISDVRKIKAHSAKLHEEVKVGKRSVPKAKREVVRRQKSAEMERKAEAAIETFRDEQPQWLLIHSDVSEGLQSIIDQHNPARLIVADPPYNIGIDYGSGKKADQRPDAQYMLWAKEWIELAWQSLTWDGSLWIVICDEYAAEYNITLKQAGFTIRSWIKWYETFGANCPSSFNRTSRHIFYAVRDRKQFVFNAEVVTRPSDRQAKYNDKRAIETGKIWDDVWQIPRLSGTCAERMPDFPTQLPLALIQPIVECASDPGDLVVDPFNGSGTTGVACLRSLRKYIGIDNSKEWIDRAHLRLDAERHDIQ